MATAATLGAELLLFLASSAARLSGYPEIPPEQLPPVRVAPAAEIAQGACPEEPDRCRGLAATFETERYEILIRDDLDLDDAGDNSFLLHELVHVLQWKRDGDAIFASCRATLKTESEAYKAQNAYLKREGQFLRFGEMLAYTQCAEDTGTLFPDEVFRGSYGDTDGQPLTRPGERGGPSSLDRPPPAPLP